MERTPKHNAKKRNNRTLQEAQTSKMKRATVSPGIQYDNTTEKYIVEFNHGRLNGKSIRTHSTFTDLKSAEDALIQFKAQKISGLSPAAGAVITMSECVREYIEHSLALDRIEQTTALTYRKTLKHLEGTSLGKKKLNKIQPKDIENYLLLLKKHTKLKNTTINKDLELIGIVFRYAINQGYIKDNPALTIPKLKKEQYEETPLTIEELRTLESELSSQGDWALIVTFYLGG